ncbi:hypothetical protein NGM10_12335 [Halorussus salilacus]|uniref:hypothetical protein n=1 Tax=Halorussus salilacus TaxID=2953750 RepID=UPI0020A02DCC|nr:hypothetical protein [Halorussus salilacus]USZ67513.1 hypothetical protein NGM10_12335 [Halorussus salilacus]
MMGRVRPRSGIAVFAGVSYYDLVLLLVPLPLVLGLLADRFLAVSRMGLVAGALLSALVVAHVLFRRPPTRGGRNGPDGPRGPANGPSA